MKSDVKLPIPVPFVVFVVRPIVGFGNVDQIIPLAVTGDPPSYITFPPLVAVFGVTLEELVVFNVGRVETHIGLPSLSTVNI